MSASSGEETSIPVKVIIKDLTRRRGAVKGKLTLFEKFLNGLREASDPSELQISEISLRLENAKGFLTEFNSIQTKIETKTDESDLESVTEFREYFENKYFMLVSLAQQLLDKSKSSKTSDQPTYRAGSKTDSFAVRLPTINLPSFDGSFDQWIEFRDMYLSLIHTSEQIGSIQKFHYLRSCLSGTAAQVIKSLEFTSENYGTAWNLLEVTKESSSQLRRLIDTVTKHLRVLKSLKEPTEYWDTLIIYIVASKLDNVSEREWENHKGTFFTENKLSLNDLITFLKNRAEMLETLNLNRNKNVVNKSAILQTSVSNVSANKNKKRPHNCPCCKGDNYHRLYLCEKFLNLDTNDKFKYVKNNHLCINCLRGGHSVSDCVFGSCKHCSTKHNSLLHRDSNLGDTVQTIAAKIDGNTAVLHSISDTHNSEDANNYSLPNQVILASVQVEVKTVNGSFLTARGLLDSCSQNSFITQSLYDKLKIPKIQSTYKISGVGNTETTCTETCDIQIKSKIHSFSKRVRCLILPRITNLPVIDTSALSSRSNINIPKYVQLADPFYNKSSHIDFLLGADLFWDLMLDGRIRLECGPWLQNTLLGWIISGPLYNKNLRFNNRTLCNFTQEISQQLSRFWELETIPQNTNTSAIYTPEERACEHLFVNTTKRNEEGRFIVRMPLKESPDSLGDTYELSYKRFLSLERKFLKFPDLKESYVKFMREYEQLDHMTEVSSYEKPFYITPHHGVYREHAVSTKLRVVFDASACSIPNKSLNAIQYAGPALQNDLFGILLRFRMHKYVACADIEKMFRQILIQNDQRNLQLILWRENKSDPLKIFQLNTITYGQVCSPFLSMRCLKQLAMECSNENIARVINQDMYVDDLITGSDNKDELLHICNQIKTIFSSACFPLHKWIFNFDNDSPNLHSKKSLSLENECQNKTLGLGWDFNVDNLFYDTKLKLENVSTVPTKRSMLSIIAQVYDPLGLITPFIVNFKIILQKLWLCKLYWDDPVPLEISQQWNNLTRCFKNLGIFRIPRYILDATSHFELHIFVDASQNAYGACAFIRCVTNTKITTKLLCAKSKVAPLKSLSIPKLELCGALVGARLFQKIVTSIVNFSFVKRFCWTDSTIVLGWLRMSPHLLKVFVQNRVSEINELTSTCSWRHVSSKENPADLLSRGVDFQALKHSNLWWEGPSFLSQDESEWLNIDEKDSYMPEQDLPEVKKSDTVSLFVTNYSYFLNRFSSFNRMKRSFAYLLRFTRNCRNKIRITGPLSVEELENSLKYLIRFSQIQSFPIEYECLLNKKQLKCTRNISKLNIFLDEDKIIRIGGRLNNSSDFSYNKKHPILLCGKNRFTYLLFKHEHLKLLHTGPQQLLFSLRETWWPLSGRDLARRTVNECILCTRFKGRTLTPIMGNLPQERLESLFPFYKCGVDYSGAINILNKKGRGARLEKAYICLFVCFSTRAVHLELVTSLTTEGYLLALKRFIARRGKPLEIFSDNGKCLVGAMKELSSFLASNSNTIIDNLASENIKFTFIPPYSPHFGGLWEAGIKSCKHHLKRVVQNANLTYEELSTVLIQIEAVLNSRPLSFISSDPNDYTPLTPSHFIIGRTLTAPPCPDDSLRKLSQLTRFRRIEHIRHHFWERWSKEYVSELQHRVKWRTHSEDIQPNTMVLIKDDNLPPLKWQLGRVLTVQPGKDGVARVAVISTSKGQIKRSFSNVTSLDWTPLT